MIKRIFHSLTSALRELFRRWGALLILLGLYLAMLGAIYEFIATREATVGQLFLSVLFALAAPILFLVIQTMAARYNQGSQRSWGLLGGSARDFWKLLVISLPLILIAVLAFYLFGKIETTAPAAAVRDAVRAAPADGLAEEAGDDGTGQRRQRHPQQRRRGKRCSHVSFSP